MGEQKQPQSSKDNTNQGVGHLNSTDTANLPDQDPSQRTGDDTNPYQTTGAFDETAAFDPSEIRTAADKILVQQGPTSVGPAVEPRIRKSKFKSTHGRSALAKAAKGRAPEPKAPPPTPDEIPPKSPARERLENIARLHRDGDVFPNQSLLREWPELFPGTLSTTATLGSQGLKVVSVHVSNIKDVPEIAQSLFTKVNYAIVAAVTPNLINGDGYFIDIIVDKESAEKTTNIIEESGYSKRVKAGADGSELSFTHSGINIFGQNIEGLHNKLLDPNYKDHGQAQTTPPSEPAQQQDFLRKGNLRSRAEKPKTKEEKERFMAHIRLETGPGSSLRAIQQTISTIVTNKYGCTAVFSNQDILIFSEAERPTAIGRAVRDEIREYLERIYTGRFTTKLLRANIGHIYHTQDESTTKTIGTERNQYPIAIPPSAEGDFIEKCLAIKGIHGEITTDSSLEPFTNATRYFDLGLQLGSIEDEEGSTKTVKKEKAELVLPERGFVGREKEIERLKNLLNQTENGAKIIELRGVAGVGKTELLLQSMPKDTIIIRPGEGKMGIEISDFSNMLIDHIKTHQISGGIGFQKGVKYLEKVLETPHLYSEDEFVARTLSILQAISEYKQENGDFFGLMIDDIDDIKPPAFGAIFRLLGEIKGRPERYKNILVALSRRSDINYSEDMGEEAAHIGRHLSLKQISERFVDEDGKIYIEPLKLGAEKDGTPEYAQWLEEFIVGKVMQRVDNGKHINKINETRVRNTTLIGNLISQMSGRKQPDGTIFAVPHYMVQAINELIFHGYLNYDKETNEIYLINYAEAKKLMPKEPEGLHAIQFERLEWYEQQGICMLYALEGVDTKTVIELKSKFSHLGILDELKEGREMLEKSDKITLVRQWRTFLQGHFEQNPEMAQSLKIDLINAILEILESKGQEEISIDPIVLYKLSHQYVFSHASPEIQEILSQKSLMAATQAIENYDFKMAKECAMHFLARPNTSNADKFSAHIIELKACIAENDKEGIIRNRLSALEFAETEEQKEIIAQIALKGAYHQYKHCQLTQADTNKALEEYDKRLAELSEKLDDNTQGYKKALLLHHIASILVERIAANSYDHDKHKALYKIESEESQSKDALYNHAIQLAEQAQAELKKIEEKSLRQWEKELMVANLNLQCVLHLELVRSWYGSQNTPIIMASEQGEERVTQHLKKGKTLANESLKIASKHGVFAPETKARSALNRLMAAMYQGETEGVTELLEAAIAQIGFAHESTTKSMLIHIAVTALDIRRAKKDLPEALEKHLETINRDINADLYTQDSEYVLNIYNYAESCIFRSLSMTQETAEKELQKAIKILKKGAKHYTQGTNKIYLPNFVQLIGQHAIAAHRINSTNFEDDYREILTAKDVIITKTKMGASEAIADPEHHLPEAGKVQTAHQFDKVQEKVGLDLLLKILTKE